MTRRGRRRGTHRRRALASATKDPPLPPIPAPVPDLTRRFAEARGVLEAAPGAAIALARDLLFADPGSSSARLLLATALRRSGDPRGALAVLQPLASTSRAWGVSFEVAAAHALLGATALAIPALEMALSLNPSAIAARHALADQLLTLGDGAGAAESLRPLAPDQPFDLALLDAVRPLFDGAFEQARRALLDRFGLSLNDPLVAVMAADAALRCGAARVVLPLLKALVARFPAYGPARRRLADVELRRRRAPEALVALGERGDATELSIDLLVFKAGALAQTGALDAALGIYDAILADSVADPGLFLSRGHVQKALGRRAEAASDYRRAISLKPGFGEAYWSLANLKRVSFTPSEIEAMERLLREANTTASDKITLAFALGKAREDLGDASGAFDMYCLGAGLRRAGAPFDRAAYCAGNARLRAAATPAHFARRQDGADLARGPIFIVGLPRSGSTLVEQILASHSMIEGLSELPDLQIVLEDFIEALAADGLSYPEALQSLPPERLLVAGRAYAARAAQHRRTARPFFTDKYPGNLHHLAFIHLAIPGARIVEIRRGAMACGFSVFRQHFAEGQDWSYELGDIAAYMAAANGLLDHVAAVAPGRIVRLSYEDLVRAPEAEIRRLLDALGLPFEPACLDFHKTRRPVRTASSEQVREPIYVKGLDEWRQYEARLEPLASALRAEGLDPFA